MSNDTNQVASEAADDTTIPALTGDAAAPAVREAAVAYAVRPSPRPRLAPTAPPAPAADDGLAALRSAADAGDARAFRRAYRAINWEIMPPDLWADAVYLALNTGQHLIACDLADRGRQRFPDHALLQKMGHILAPKQPAIIGGPGDPSARADLDWFAAHSDEYWGQWVAVKNGRLLGAAATIEELMARVPDWQGATISQVFF
jgi:hypothetical protein